MDLKTLSSRFLVSQGAEDDSLIYQIAFVDGDKPEADSWPSDWNIGLGNILADGFIRVENTMGDIDTLVVVQNLTCDKYADFLERVGNHIKKLSTVTEHGIAKLSRSEVIRCIEVTLSEINIKDLMRSYANVQPIT